MHSFQIQINGHTQTSAQDQTRPQSSTVFVLVRQIMLKPMSGQNIWAVLPVLESVDNQCSNSWAQFKSQNKRHAIGLVVQRHRHDNRQEDRHEAWQRGSSRWVASSGELQLTGGHIGEHHSRQDWTFALRNSWLNGWSKLTTLSWYKSHDRYNQKQWKWGERWIKVLDQNWWCYNRSTRRQDHNNKQTSVFKSAHKLCSLYR